MSFKIPESYHKKKKEIDGRKYVLYDGEEIHITEFEDKTVSSEMRTDMRMNSYAQDELPPKLTDEALINETKSYLKQCGRSQYPCVTYEEALIHTILPELLKRFESKHSVEDTHGNSK